MQNARLVSPLANFCVCDRTDRPNRDHDEPDQKQSEKDAEDCASRTIKQSYDQRSMLIRSPKQSRTNSADDGVNDDTEESSSQERQNRVWHSKKRAEQRP